MKIYVHIKICIHRFIAILTNGRRPETSQICINWWVKKQCSIKSTDYYGAINSNYSTSKNMDKSRKHHATWNHGNQNTEYCTMPLIQNPRKGKTSDQKLIAMVARDQRQGKGLPRGRRKHPGVTEMFPIVTVGVNNSSQPVPLGTMHFKLEMLFVCKSHLNKQKDLVLLSWNPT